MKEFYSIYKFMYEDLGLSKSELRVYALIYSFCNNVGSYKGSIGYLSERLKISTRTVMRALKSLVEKGLLIKERLYVKNATYCYRLPEGSFTVEKRADECDKKSSDMRQNVTEDVTKCHSECDKMSPNKKENNKENNKAIYTRERSSEGKGNYQRFMTESEAESKRRKKEAQERFNKQLEESLRQRYGEDFV